MRSHRISNQFALVPVTDRDHGWLCALHNDPEVLRNLTHPTPISLDEHMAWWKQTSSDPRQERFIFKKLETAGYLGSFMIGFTKFYDIDHVNKNCVLGADIVKEERGKGFAKHMWEHMLHHCFVDLGMHRVSLTTAAFNNVGQRVYRNLGFREEGRRVQSLLRDGVFHDQIAMYMLREDWA